MAMRSFQALTFCAGERSKNAGWKIDIAGMAVLSFFSYSNQRPLNRIIPSLRTNNVLEAVPPAKIKIFGLISSICLWTKGKQVAVSLVVGGLFPGGRQGMILVMYTCERANPIE